jgi:hypothetical protein
VYDTLLFLHLLAAFMVVITAVTYSAVALGADTGGRSLTVANICWDVGGLGTLILGVWLALDVDDYEVWDGWILGAIVVWAFATEAGRRARVEFASEGGAGRASLMHWLRTALVIALLVLMVWKPGA